MQIPSEVTFHNVEHSDSIELSIERWVARLDGCNNRITRCEVTVSQPHRSHRHGRALEIAVRVGLPGAEPIISHASHEDPYVAIADAFRAARRQLLDRADRMRDYVDAPTTERGVLPILAKGRYTLTT
ncbi:MAG TPA: HPF/RaiA family ribosome-associated protein [Kofleriaceae bacterium]